MKQKKLLYLFFGLVSLVFSLNAISSTYAKYATKSISNNSLNVARWDIVVNDRHIKNNSTENAIIEPKYIDNPNVTAGVIAPGSVGYFDLTIDGSYTDVSFDFDIEVLPNENSIVQDLRIMKYYIDDVDNITDAIDNNITGSINHDDENKVKTVRIYIIWDDENGSMTNEEDTVAGHSADTQDASVDVRLNFKQKISLTE